MKISFYVGLKINSADALFRNEFLTSTRIKYQILWIFHSPIDCTEKAEHFQNNTFFDKIESISVSKYEN